MRRRQSQSPPQQQQQRGFTLLEVLVAITVFAVMSAGIYRVLSAMVQTQERVVSHAEDLRELQRAMWIMAADLEQVVMRDVKGDFRERLPAMVSNEDDSVLQFTRQGLRNPLLLNRSDLQRVAYALGSEPVSDSGHAASSRSGQTESRHLLRQVWGALDRISDTRVDTQVLLHDVDEVELEFVDVEGNKSERWPPKKKLGKAGHVRDLPVSVTIRLQTRRYGEVVRVFQLGNIVRIKPAAQPAGGGR